jgi:hypothetical protein
MEHALGMSHKDNHSDELMDGIVMLLDPDMILLRPLIAVQQPGNVTRIASGFTAQQMVALMHFRERYVHSMSQNVLLPILHLTTHESMRDGVAAAVTIRTSKLKRNE